MRIRKFQDIIKSTYYERDKTRGIEKTFMWAIEEIGELSRAIKKNNKEEIKMEFSDVIAWLFSLANLLNLDVENVLRRYESGCPKCKSIPCECKKEVQF
jgi:NTP pyrophosphatase (non-canonical NTP hydrolase)